MAARTASLDKNVEITSLSTSLYKLFTYLRTYFLMRSGIARVSGVTQFYLPPTRLSVGLADL